MTKSIGKKKLGGTVYSASDERYFKFLIEEERQERLSKFWGHVAMFFVIFFLCFLLMFFIVSWSNSFLSLTDSQRLNSFFEICLVSFFPTLLFPLVFTCPLYDWFNN